MPLAAQCALRWRAHHQRLEELKGRLGSRLWPVRYEDLIYNTATQLASLQEYLLIAQNRPHVEQYTRQPDGRWLLSEADQLDAVVRLSSLGCDLKLADVYEDVSFEPPARPNAAPR